MPERIKLRAGFTDPVFQSQAIFRVLLEAMSRPGRTLDIPLEVDTPAGIAPATACVCLCLLDNTTSLWIDASLRTPEARSYLEFHTGSTQITDQGSADIAILSEDVQPHDIAAFNPGTPEYPDRATTVIVQVADMSEEPGVVLSGPGIETEQRLQLAGVTPTLWRAVAVNHARFPLGVDFIFVAGNRIAGLPRSTHVDF